MKKKFGRIKQDYLLDRKRKKCWKKVGEKVGKKVEEKVGEKVGKKVGEKRLEIIYNYISKFYFSLQLSLIIQVYNLSNKHLLFCFCFSFFVLISF